MEARSTWRRWLRCAALAVAFGACASGSVGPPGDGAVDTSPPVVIGCTPTGLLQYGTTSAALTVVTDEPATCRYDVTDVPYASMTGAFADAGTTHTAALAGLSSGATYMFYLRCADASGNAATSSYTASFRIAASVPQILWRDDIQGSSALLGFDGFGVEHPIGTAVAPADGNGANLSRVADPLPGGGSAMRHLGTFDAGGSRAQAGLYGDVNTVFGQQAKQPEGVWVAQEWYFPEAIDANDDPWCWISVWDWHSIDATTRGNRWHTSPGLLVARDGSMRLELVWGGAAGNVNGEGVTSTLSMPVGRWFDIEMHYEWVDTQTGTIQVWIDGALALEQRGVQTRSSTHGVVETYMKFYGSTQGLHGPWSPTPTLKYTRNVRVAAERIWR